MSFDLPMFQCCALWGYHHHLHDWQWPSLWEIRYVLAECLAPSPPPLPSSLAVQSVCIKRCN